MFSRFRSSARRNTNPPPFEQDQSEAAAMLSGQQLSFAPMRPLLPPAAQNDDLGRRVYEAVRRELREAGHLS